MRRTDDCVEPRGEPPVPLTHIQTAEVKGPTKEHVYIGYRLDGDGTKDALLARMTDMITATRTFESTQKGIQAYDQMMGKTVNEIPKLSGQG